MKLVTIKVPANTDLALLPLGTAASITVGANTIAGGTVEAVSQVSDPDVVDHSHPATTAVGPPS